jgi:hypothetical protein
MSELFNNASPHEQFEMRPSSLKRWLSSLATGLVDTLFPDEIVVVVPSYGAVTTDLDLNSQHEIEQALKNLHIALEGQREESNDV